MKRLLVLLVFLPGVQLQAAFETGTAIDPALGQIDAVAFDGKSGQIYVASGNTVSAFTAADSSEQRGLEFAGDITGLTLLEKQRRGIVSLGGSGSIQVFDLDSMAVVASVEVQGKPGASVYDPATGRIFVADTSTAQLYVLDDLADGTAEAVAIAGVAGSMVVDQRGFLYGVLAGEPGLFILDSRTLQSQGRFQIPACSAATDIANDFIERRLFVPCDNGYLFVLDPDTGLVLSRLDIGLGSSSVGLDFEDNRMLNIFVASKKGGVTLGRVEKVTFFVVETLEDLPASSDVAVDDATGRAFFAAGTKLNLIQPATAGGATP